MCVCNQVTFIGDLLFSCSVMSSSLRTHGRQHIRLPVLHYSQSLCKFMSIELVMLSNHLILCHLLLFLSSIFPSIRVFSNESALHIRWPKYWSFNISPSSEYSGLISFRINWFDILAVRRTLKSLLQHHNLKILILRCSAFFHLCFQSSFTLYSIYQYFIPFCC